ncbi:MAG: hypothetical protein WAO49_02720 [Arcanobacterium sp.]
MAIKLPTQPKERLRAALPDGYTEYGYDGDTGDGRAYGAYGSINFGDVSVTQWVYSLPMGLNIDAPDIVPCPYPTQTDLRGARELVNDLQRAISFVEGL